jgi:hypothetical protein
MIRCCRKIRALLARHNRVEAIERYGAAGVDTTTATQVTDTLESKE